MSPKRSLTLGSSSTRLNARSHADSSQGRSPARFRAPGTPCPGAVKENSPFVSHGSCDECTTSNSRRRSVFLLVYARALLRAADRSLTQPFSKSCRRFYTLFATDQQHRTHGSAFDTTLKTTPTSALVPRRQTARIPSPAPAQDISSSAPRSQRAAVARPAPRVHRHFRSTRTQSGWVTQAQPGAASPGFPSLQLPAAGIGEAG